MADLFGAARMGEGAPRPLADRLRPRALGEVVGQEHLTGPDGALTRLVASGEAGSLVLWGPPGSGKTTVARLLAEALRRAAGGGARALHHDELSAVFTGVADLKRVFESARARRAAGQRTLLFVDEIHRFNRSQQDAFLPVMEDGTIVLVGATTENPSFALNAALLSRARVLVFRPLGPGAIEALIARAEAAQGRPLPLIAGAREALARMADGDGRAALTLAEEVWRGARPGESLDAAALAEVVQRRAPLYDRAGEGHYNLISALHKAIRGSDPDAALYWFARMVDGGEDPLFIARRLVRAASEDVGLADPRALRVALDAKEAFDFLGSPEGELALGACVLYLACAPKSNAAHAAQKAAMRAAKSHGSLPPPKTILNAPTQLMREQGYGEGYEYDHDAPDAFSGQDYFPEAMTPAGERPSFYAPVPRGEEAAIGERLARWAALRRERAAERRS